MNIIFLMGAGCETHHDIGMKSGIEFKKETIRCENGNDFFNYINHKNTYKMSKDILFAHNATSILYQTIKEVGKEFLNKESEKNKEIIVRYLKYKDGKQDKQYKPDEFRAYFKEYYYDLIKENKTMHNGEDRKDILDLFLENAGIYSYVDSLFNYLRYPEKYHVECARVMRLYFSAYLVIIKPMLETTFGIDSLQKIINKSRSGETVLNRKKWMDIIEECTSFIVDRVNKNDIIYVEDNLNNKLSNNEKTNDQKNDRVYYKMISDNENIKPKIITTNYTGFAQRIMSLGDQDIAYIHGKLEWFEDIKTKRIGYMNEFEENDCIFPFIFVQSGVKPIVSHKQLIEYSKGVHWICHSSNEEYPVIVILGYGINSDDDHVNDLLLSALEQGKIVIDFVYKLEQKSKVEIEKIYKKLIYNDNLYLVDTNYFSEFISSIDNNKTLDNIIKFCMSKRAGKVEVAV